MKIFENIILGGGASGLMFAAHLKVKKNSLIIEGNSKLGAKILISGGGRCNFTNRNITKDDYLTSSDYLDKFLKEFPPKYILNWFSKRGLEYSIKNGREYFCKNRAKELLDILLKEIKGINLELNCKILSVSKKDNIFKVTTSKGDFFAKRVVVATGGVSFSKVGATDIGFEIAKNFGHKVNRLNPALVGFTLQKEQSFFKELAGVSAEVKVFVKDKTFKGNLLFAHKGISGPAILNASLFWDKGHIVIDFLPNFNLENLKRKNSSISNSLPLAKRLSKAFLEHLEIKDKAGIKIDSNDFEKLKKLKCYTFAPAGTFGYSKAEVTKGGVDLNDIILDNFMSKKIKNLHFIGEVLDTTGRLGGFNFHFAFSSAIKCAKNL